MVAILTILSSPICACGGGVSQSLLTPAPPSFLTLEFLGERRNNRNYIILKLMVCTHTRKEDNLMTHRCKSQPTYEEYQKRLQIQSALLV
ncbi:hypothetical protein POVWA2_033850 [Plasmodium ovale wallikeri]|uniref:Secreted protein n=1 Tax=Plasmodium ovale wallikeri TaxID=864142 RepID=A0A1A8YZ15_PLAOA|nr:hypothetical protein POVWA1_034680 [Plasmodium ovale wallikeri]SBT37484.1 hypothetical protein POVWA2_033850 [Plasmodium ovale wallikeri]